ncbi:glycosyltransferase [Chloroflexota bacterium]
MKIAQVISTGPFAWATGGPSRVIYELSKALVKRGHDITILTTDMYTPRQRWVSNNDQDFTDGIRILRFKYVSNCLAWKRKTILSPGLISYLRKHINEFDIVHLQELISIQAVITSKYCTKNHIPYVLTTHGSIPWLNEQKLLNMAFKFMWGSNILMNAIAITCLTDFEAELCRRMGINAEKIKVIPNGVALSEFDNLPARGEFRKKHDLSGDVKIVLYIGRIHRTKGLGFLMRAFERLLRNQRYIMLVIVGPDDGYMRVLKKLAGNLKIVSNVLFTGPLYGREKLEAYVDADVFVTPCFSGFPLTFVESCACGVPVITTENGDRLEWLDNQAGFITPYNEEKLSESLGHLLSDNQAIQALGNMGRLLVRERFNWPKIAADIEDVYLRVVK